MEEQMAQATLAGGCFWCLEAVFEQLRGVHAVRSGYTGGHIRNPSYQQVCGGNTGHAEALQIDFDANVITFRDLLDVFFTIHDPTTKDRQGADIGPQYRSAVFYDSPEQKETAEQVIRELDATKLWPSPIVTEVAPLGEFFAAEDYHHEYYRRNPLQPYCRMVIDPKVAKFRKQYFEKLRA
jgi:peptide-methionine (S)-S-oxide reductase